MTTIAGQTTDAQTQIEVVGGVNAPRDTHTAAALDAGGRMLAHRTFAATPAGYRRLRAWLDT
jgi:hypothetical protein